MYGTNEVRHKEVREDGRLQVNSIFYTLQGEGPYAGWPAVFIRMTGCNLRCTFCDTQWEDEKDPYMTVKEIVDEVMRVRHPKCRLIVITGGEPLRQDMSQLLPALYRENMTGRLLVQFETAGTLWQDCLFSYLRDGVSLVVSPKTPKINENVHRYAVAFKYVIKEGEVSDEDGLPNCSTQVDRLDALIARPRPFTEVYLSPCDERELWRTQLNEQTVARLAMEFGYIAGLQLHKIWDIK